MKFILAKKIGMTQVFDETGKVHPVTLLEAGPAVVTQVKTKEKDGYAAVQVGFGGKKAKRLSKPEKGHLKELGAFRWLREFRLDNGDAEFKLGDKIEVSNFAAGDVVKISALTKGRGFQGVVKRHGFHGAPRTHGTSHAGREPGSIGATHPQHVIKGRRMAGHMGMERATIKNIKVFNVDAEKNLLAIEGAVPGARGTLVEVRG